MVRRDQGQILRLDSTQGIVHPLTTVLRWARPPARLESGTAIPARMTLGGQPSSCFRTNVPHNVIGELRDASIPWHREEGFPLTAQKRPGSLLTTDSSPRWEVSCSKSEPVALKSLLARRGFASPDDRNRHR